MAAAILPHYIGGAPVLRPQYITAPAPPVLSAATVTAITATTAKPRVTITI